MAFCGPAEGLLDTALRDLLPKVALFCGCLSLSVSLSGLCLAGLCLAGLCLAGLGWLALEEWSPWSPDAAVC